VARRPLHHQLAEKDTSLSLASLCVRHAQKDTIATVKQQHKPICGQIRSVQEEASVMVVSKQLLMLRNVQKDTIALKLLPVRFLALWEHLTERKVVLTLLPANLAQKASIVKREQLNPQRSVTQASIVQQI
jgi:hypothetical protein